MQPHPEMDYWKDRPKDLLVDDWINTLSPEALTAWFWLRERARCQKPPGILPADEQILRRWSRLKPKQWTEVREEILGQFSRDSEGRYHDQKIKAEYLDFCRISHQKSVEGTRKSNVRWKKKDPDPRFQDPYVGYHIPLHAAGMQQHAGGMAQNGDPASIMPMHAAGMQQHAIAFPLHTNTSIHSIDGLGDDSPPAQGGAVTHPSPFPSSTPAPPPAPPPPQKPPLPHRPLGKPPVDRPPMVSLDAVERAERSVHGRAALNRLLAMENATAQPAAPPPPSSPPPPPPSPAESADADGVTETPPPEQENPRAPSHEEQTEVVR